MFRVDPKTVTRWAKAGKLTSIRTLGGHRRYKESEVRGLLAGGSPGMGVVWGPGVRFRGGAGGGRGGGLVYPADAADAEADESSRRHCVMTSAITNTCTGGGISAGRLTRAFELKTPFLSMLPTTRSPTDTS